MTPATTEQATERPTLRVIALDDDADFREFLGSVLETAGHTPVLAATPDEFFAECEAALPDVVLLDMKMGDADGGDVLRGLRERWPKLCVIVLTGYPSLDSMRQTFKQDIFDYVPKPFETADLLDVLTQAAEAHGLGRSPQDRLRASLGRAIRLSRTGKRWTLKELSEASGVSVSQLSSIERGAHLPSLESLIAVAGALEEQPSDWLGSAGF